MNEKGVEQIKNITAWYRLMQEARNQGLTPDEVRIILKQLKEEK